MCILRSILRQLLTKVKLIFPCMEKVCKNDSCQSMLHLRQNCKRGETLMDPSMRWEGFVALEWQSICTSYSSETAKQEVIYSWRIALVCRTVSSCDATPSFPRKFWSPLWVEAGGRSPTVFSGFILHKDSAQPTEICLLPQLTPKWGKPRDVQEDVALKKWPCQSCSLE